jgi:hypothetical protein
MVGAREYITKITSSTGKGHDRSADSKHRFKEFQSVFVEILDTFSVILDKF